MPVSAVTVTAMPMTANAPGENIIAAAMQQRGEFTKHCVTSRSFGLNSPMCLKEARLLRAASTGFRVLRDAWRENCLAPPPKMISPFENSIFFPKRISPADPGRPDAEASFSPRPINANRQHIGRLPTTEWEKRNV
jgi:hypothetical protein